MTNLDRSLDAEDPLADAGAALVFQSKRKVEQAVPEALGWVLRKYGKAWNKRFGERALLNLREWINARYGEEALSFTDSNERRAFKSASRREFRRARRRGVDALELAAPEVQRVRLAEGAFRSLSVGVEAVNIAYAARNLRDNPRDGWAWVDATGALLDGYGALEGLSAVPAVEVKLSGRMLGLKAFAPLALAAGAIDVAGGLRGMASAGEGGERFGFAMVTGGATLALVGAFAATGPLFIGLLAIGLGAQAVGQGLASASGPLQRFLRNGRFGNGGGWIDHTADFVDRTVDEPWYQGKKLSALKADLPGQLTALDEILYGFEVQVGNAGSRIILELELQVPGQLTDMAIWKIEATVNRDGRKTPVNIDDAVLSSSPEEQVRKFVTLMDADPPSIATRSEGAAYVRDVSVEGWVTLDVRGGIFAGAGSEDVPAAFKQAARPVIKREIKGAFRIGG